MEVIGAEDSHHGQYVADIHDGRFITGSYVMDWVQPLRIPEIFGARNLGLDPNNIEYYLISEEERQRRLRRERSPFLFPSPIVLDYVALGEVEINREYEYTIGYTEEQYTGDIEWTHDWGSPDEEEDEET